MCVCEWPCDCATVTFCTPKQMQTEQRGYCSLFENLWQLQQQHPAQWHTHVLLKQRLHKYSTSLWCVAHTHTHYKCVRQSTEHYYLCTTRYVVYVLPPPRNERRHGVFALALVHARMHSSSSHGETHAATRKIEWQKCMHDEFVHIKMIYIFRNL